MPSCTRKNGSPIPRYSAASSIRRISRYASSCEMSSRPAVPPFAAGSAERARAAVPRADATEASFCKRRALASADSPNRFPPAAIALFGSGRVQIGRFRHFGGIGKRGGSVLARAFVALREPEKFTWLRTRRQRARKAFHDRGNARPLGERHQRQIDAQPAFERETQLDGHQ